MSARRDRILLYCEMPEGGMAEHSHYQANALTRAGVETFVITSRGFLPDTAGKNYTVLPWLVPIYPKIRNRLLKAAYFAAAMVINELIFAFRILFWGHRRVLIAGSSEALALIWVWPHVALRWLGVRYAVNIHDPQRKRIEGSALLHRWAIKAGFLPISYGLIHEDFDSEQPDIPRHVVCLPAPYGCYEAQIEPGDGAALRAELVPAGEERYVFLAFGYVADRKNIDLCIRAIADLPKAVLVVAGRLASVHDKPASYYRALAAELGCADRVRIDEGFIPEGAIRDYFGASDAILLTYKAEFVSQSGVLLLASNWGKPVLASSGPGPLSRTVSKFDLGPTVPADDIVALRTAMEQLIEHGYDARGWPAFRAHATWDSNVAALLRAFDGQAVSAVPAGEMT
ncbi:MAG: glycosyltransferase [Pseudomonadota bacterium]